MNFDIEAAFAPMMELARQRRAKFDEFLISQPKSIRCQSHPEEVLILDIDRSESQSNGAGQMVAAYDLCRVCEQERIAAKSAARLHAQGAPAILSDSTLENWTPRDADEHKHLAAVREFIAAKRGFVVMLGSFGTGKSHLAVAAMRSFKTARYVKQHTLLQQLRQTYRDKAAEDPVGACKATELLVLDEVGISSGGKDEFPMLHEILDHRYGELMPTILTGNLDVVEFKEFIGPRMFDRLRQSARILTFAGPSHRAGKRDNYFAGN